MTITTVVATWANSQKIRIEGLANPCVRGLKIANQRPVKIEVTLQEPISDKDMAFLLRDASLAIRPPDGQPGVIVNEMPLKEFLETRK